MGRRPPCFGPYHYFLGHADGGVVPILPERHARKSGIPNKTMLDETSLDLRVALILNHKYHHAVTNVLIEVKKEGMSQVRSPMSVNHGGKRQTTTQKM